MYEPDEDEDDKAGTDEDDKASTEEIEAELEVAQAEIGAEPTTEAEPAPKRGRRRNPDPVAVTDRTPEQSRLALRRKVRMFYDLQRMRIQCAARTQRKAPDAEIQLHEVDLAILERRAKSLHREEREALRDVEQHLRTIHAYTELLADRVRFRGIGPTMAGVILSEIDIYRAATPSQIWSFAGLAPVAFHACCRCGVEVDKIPDVTGHYEHPTARTSCERKGDLLFDEDVVIRRRAARPQKGVKLSYNKFLRTKMVGVLGAVLLQVDSPYRRFYDAYKGRKSSAGWGKSDAHRHRAAVRYMVKTLLADIWRGWRTVEGLPVRSSYQEEYLGHTHVSDR
jgi:hypothetical protein